MKLHHGTDCPCHLTFKERITHFTPILQQLQHLNKRKLRAAVKKIDFCLMRHLFYLSKALLEKDIELKKSIYPQFKPYRKSLLRLASNVSSLTNKRDHLLSRGGQLGLIPLLASVVGPLLGEWLGKKIRG